MKKSDLVDELGDKDDGGDDAGDEADGPDHDVERGQRHPFVAVKQDKTPMDPFFFHKILGIIRQEWAIRRRREQIRMR